MGREGGCTRGLPHPAPSHTALLHLPLYPPPPPTFFVCRDTEETKLDQFWNFPGIENEVTFTGFNQWKKDAFSPLLVAFQKLAVKKGLAKDEEEMKSKGKRLAGAVGAWVKENFDSLQFYSVESWVVDGEEIDESLKGTTVAANMAMVRYEEGTPYFYFMSDLFNMRKL